MSKRERHDDEEESFDPKKLFDATQYNTVFVGREGFSQKQNSAADLVDRLLLPGLTRAEYEEIFKGLKKFDARDLLVEALSKAPDEHKRVLAAACWESGLDFSDHFVFFSRLVINEPFAVGMEALTVITEMETAPSPEQIRLVMAEIRGSGVGASAMVNELEEYLGKLPQ